MWIKEGFVQKIPFFMHKLYLNGNNKKIEKSVLTNNGSGDILTKLSRTTQASEKRQKKD